MEGDDFNLYQGLSNIIFPIPSFYFNIAAGLQLFF